MCCYNLLSDKPIERDMNLAIAQSAQGECGEEQNEYPLELWTNLLDAWDSSGLVLIY